MALGAGEEHVRDFTETFHSATADNRYGGEEKCEETKEGQNVYLEKRKNKEKH